MLVTHRIKGEREERERQSYKREEREREADYNQTRTESEPNQSAKWSMMMLKFSVLDFFLSL